MKILSTSFMEKEIKITKFNSIRNLENYLDRIRFTIVNGSQPIFNKTRLLK
jgi:hypothetical protein